VLYQLAMLRSAVAALGVACAVTRVAAAQVHLDVVPYAGVYVPTAKLVDEPTIPVTFEQNASFALGSRVIVWLPGRLGIEGTFGYTSSGLTQVGDLGSGPHAAHVITASARVVVPVSLAGGPPVFRLGGGVGLVGHGGAGYAGASGATRLAGTVSAGAAFKLGASALTLRLDAEDYLYGAHFSATSFTCTTNLGLCGVVKRDPYTKSRFQNDVVLSLGLAVARGGR